MIEKIQNNEQGLSVRQKLNAIIDSVNHKQIIIPELLLKLKRYSPHAYDYSTGNITDELYVYWDSTNLEFLNYNPEIWLFRWKRNNRYSSSGTMKQRKFWHPPHHSGIKWKDKHPAWYAGATLNRRLEVINYTTEFAMTPRGQWAHIPINIYEWAKGSTSETEALTYNKGLRGQSPNLMTIRMALAIVIDNPQWNEQSPITLNPKLFGKFTVFALTMHKTIDLNGQYFKIGFEIK